MGRRQKSGPRPVLQDGKLQVRRAVAYARMKVFGYSATQSRLMLSVYVKCYARVYSDDEQAWLLGAREYVLRNTTEADQLALLDALTYKTALRFDRDFLIEHEANTKQPKEIDLGIQRPDA